MYSQKTGVYTCSRCAHTLPFTKRCRRGLTIAKIVYHTAGLAAALGIFYALSRINAVFGVVAALVLIPLVTGMGDQLISYYFFRRGKFELDV